MHLPQLVLLTSSCSIFVLVPLQSLHIHHFQFLLILLCGMPGQQIYYSAGSIFFFFFWFCFIVRSSSREMVICFYLKISQSLVRLILLDRIHVVHIPLKICTNFNFLHNSPWITFTTQSDLVLYSFRLICSTRSLCDWSFRLCQVIMSTSYFVASYRLLSLIIVITH